VGQKAILMGVEAHELPRVPGGEVNPMPKGMKNNEGNKYNTNPNYADQVIKNHEKQPAQNNPGESDETLRHK